MYRILVTGTLINNCIFYNFNYVTSLAIFIYLIQCMSSIFKNKYFFLIYNNLIYKKQCTKLVYILVHIGCDTHSICVLTYKIQLYANFYILVYNFENIMRVLSNINMYIENLYIFCVDILSMYVLVLVSMQLVEYVKPKTIE